MSSQVIKFLGIAKVSVKVKHRVGYNTVFFLINKSTIVLLGQPFIKAIKLTFKYLEDRSIKAVIVSPKSKGFTYIVIVVPLLRQGHRTAKQAFAKEKSDNKEEN